MTITIHEVTALPGGEGGTDNIRRGSRRPKKVPFLIQASGIRNGRGFYYLKDMEW